MSGILHPEGFRVVDFHEFEEILTVDGPAQPELWRDSPAIRIHVDEVFWKAVHMQKLLFAGVSKVLEGRSQVRFERYETKLAPGRYFVPLRGIKR